MSAKFPRGGGSRTFFSSKSICFHGLIQLTFFQNKMNQIIFPIDILGQVWYLIVSIPDLCTLTYFTNTISLGPNWV